MIVPDSEMGVIEKLTAMGGSVPSYTVHRLIESHRELASIVKDLVNLRHGEMLLNRRLSRSACPCGIGSRFQTLISNCPGNSRATALGQRCTTRHRRFPSHIFSPIVPPDHPRGARP